MSKVCVVLATYNGEKYLPAMLDSLAVQTRPADLIIAVDDGSSDGSVQVLRDYGERLPIQIHVSERNQGHRAAFSRALTLAKEQLSPGDYIALADQDDIWLPNKFQVLESALETHKVDLVFGDAQVVNGEGAVTGESWRALCNIPEHLSLRALTTGFSNVTGCMCLFRASLLDTILPIPEDAYVHDQWITLCASARNGYRAIPDAVIQYRLHGNNAIGAGDKYTWSGKHELNLNWARMLSRTELYESFSQGDKQFVQEYIHYMESRFSSNFVPQFLFWVIRNGSALFPHIHSALGMIPRYLLSVIGIPFAVRYLGKK